MKRMFCICGVAAVMSGLACSWTSGVMEGGKAVMNLSKKDSHLTIMLDGDKAEQNLVKKAALGYSNWKVDQLVGTAPTLKFSIVDPEELGRITMVSASIYQAFEGDYSHQAEFTITSESQDPGAQMKPDTDYNLGAMPAGFEVRNLTGQRVNGVELKPGMKYKLMLVIKADKSETAQVEFKTK